MATKSKGYLIQVAHADANGDPDGWTDAPVEKGSAIPLTTRVTKNADGTVKDDGTTYKYYSHDHNRHRATLSVMNTGIDPGGGRAGSG